MQPKKAQTQNLAHTRTRTHTHSVPHKRARATPPHTKTKHMITYTKIHIHTHKCMYTHINAQAHTSFLSKKSIYFTENPPRA